MSVETLQSVEERVAAGCAWLDQHQPGWVEEINLDELQMDDCAMCVLGQTFGDYWESPLVAGRPDTWDELDAYDELARPLGFQFTGNFGYSRDEYAELGNEWRRVIEARRAAS
jgi:hypothetical protein